MGTKYRPGQGRRPDGTVGFLCVGCGGPTMVVDSRPAPSGTIRRRRLCLSQCSKDKKFRFTTVEVDADYSEIALQVNDLKPALLRIASDLELLTRRVFRISHTAEAIEVAKKRKIS